MIDELTKLSELKDSGVISEAEYQKLKSELLECKNEENVLPKSRGLHQPAQPVVKSKKSKYVAGLLGILLGGLGIHKFYLGSWGWGLVYLLLFWTYIPALVALVEGVRYLTLSQDVFSEKANSLTGPFGWIW